MAGKGFKFNDLVIEVPQEYLERVIIGEGKITFFDQAGNKYEFFQQKVDIDKELSLNSSNPVENKAITAKFNDIEAEIDAIPNTIDEKISENNNLFIEEEVNIEGQKNFRTVGLIGRRITTTVEKTYPVASYSVENLSTTHIFSLNNNGYYESGNKGVDNSWSLCKLTFVMSEVGDLEFEVINSGESNYDYGLFSQLDKTLDNSHNQASASDVYKDYKGESSTNPVTLTYSNIPAGEHFITIKFRKDSSSSQGNDSLQFKVISNVGTYEETTSYDKVNTIVTNENDELVYNGLPVNFIPEASQNNIGGIRMWTDDTTLYISTSAYENKTVDNSVVVEGASNVIKKNNTIRIS